MSERTKELEDTAVAAILDAMPSGEDGDTLFPEMAEKVARRMYAALLEALVAKVNDNLTGELASIRRLVEAAPNESTYKAVRRMQRDLEGLKKKYREREEAARGRVWCSGRVADCAAEPTCPASTEPGREGFAKLCVVKAAEGRCEPLVLWRRA